MLRYTVLLLACLAAVLPASADATASPTSCAALFASLRGVPFVHVWWGTNYASSVRFNGVTQLQLQSNGPDLVGVGTRTKVSYAAVGSAVMPSTSLNPPALTDQVKLKIGADNKIMLQDVYGPYEPVCSSDRFASIHTGDSIETFSFRVR